MFLGEELLMRSHNIYFYGEIRKIMLWILFYLELLILYSNVVNFNFRTTVNLEIFTNAIKTPRHLTKLTLEFE